MSKADVRAPTKEIYAEDVLRLVHSAAQARAWADGDFDADHGLGL